MSAAVPWIGGIKSASFSKGVLAPILREHTDEVSAPSEPCFRIAGVLRCFLCLFLTSGKTGISGFHVVDDRPTAVEGCIKSRLEPQCFLKPLWEQTVEHAKVTVLGNSSVLLIVGSVLVDRHLKGNIKDDVGGLSMDIAATAVSIEHLRITAVE